MAVVKNVRRAGRTAGRVLDAEDRRVLGVVFIWAAGGATALIGGAAALGTAVAVFRTLSGF